MNYQDMMLCNSAFVDSDDQVVILIMNEYAYYGRCHSINSSGQIEWYTNILNDKSVQVGGNRVLFPLIDIPSH